MIDELITFQANILFYDIEGFTEQMTMIKELFDSGIISGPKPFIVEEQKMPTRPVRVRWR